MPARPLRSSGSSRPPGWWGLFAHWLALEEPEAARLWHLVSTSHHPEVRAWRVTAVYAAGRAGYRDRAVTLLRGPLAPQRVVTVLEQLVTDNKLTRQEATAMEEAILQQTTRNGAWT